MFPFIVADIGGTNARFALVTDKDGDQFKIERASFLRGADYECFEDAMAAYIARLDGIKVTSACVAIAGPIVGDRVAMTNLPWSFSQEDVRKKFDLQAFYAINDYTALAVAMSRIDASGTENIVSGIRKPMANKAVFGPGSGLGVAGLVNAGDIWLPVPSEGGHVNIPPATSFECELIKSAMLEFGHVSAETFLSGPGFVHLHRAVSQVNGVDVETLAPQDITDRAIKNSDVICRQAMDAFCSFLGTVAGNLALTYGAKGGVYITGGIVPRFPDYLKHSQFVERFHNKGKMSHYMKEIPVDVVLYEHTAFLGAAAWLNQSMLRR